MKPNILDRMHRERWHGGQLLAYSGLDGLTDWESGLNLRTMASSPGLEIRWPGRCRVNFPALTLQTPNRVTSDTVEIPSAGILAVLADAHHLLVSGPVQVTPVDPSITFLSSEGRTLVGVTAHFNPALLQSDPRPLIHSRQAWLARQALPPRDPAADRSLAKAISVLKGQVYHPEGAIRHRWTTPDRWPHRRMWLWDSAFHAIGWRHLDPAMARDAIDAVLDRQAEDGFIAHMMGPATRSPFTQPPVLALAVRRVQETAPDAEWLQRVYPLLCAYVNWDLQHRDSDGAGLVEWAIEGDPLCRSGESGMDNSPRFDSATQLDAVDFNAFLAHECEVLARFAAELGRGHEAVAWQARHRTLCDLINQRLWSDRDGFYLDYDVEHHRRSPVLASSGFLPLLCGAASDDQARRLVAHLKDPTMFASAFPIPSIAVRDTEHYAKDMWRGPVWININWLVAEGLDRYGYHQEASGLRDRTLAIIERYAEQYGTMFEFYDDREELPPPQLLRKGKCDPDPDGGNCNLVIHDYGWTASLYVDLAFRAAARP